MKFEVVGKYAGQRVIRWPLFFFWTLLVTCASLLAVLLIVVFCQKAHLLDSILFLGIVPAFAFLLSGFIVLFRSFRKPLEEIPELQQKPTAIFLSPFIKRFFSLRRLIFGAACLLTLIGLFYSVENWRGRHAFEKYKAAEAKKGVSLDWNSYVPPAVPDDQNFAFAPLLKPLLDYERRPNRQGVLWRDTNGVGRFQALTQPFHDWWRLKQPHSEDLKMNESVDLVGWQKFFIASTNVAHSATAQSPAQDVLLALKGFEAEMQGLKEAAEKRPSSRYPIQYADCMGALVPHLSRIRQMENYLRLHATAHLEQGAADLAFSDLKLGFRLAKSIEDEPFIISQLIRISALQSSLQMLREGLTRRRWTDEQLGWFQSRLAEIDLVSSAERVLHSQLAFEVEAIDQARRGVIPLRVLLEAYDPQTRAGYDPSTLEELARTPIGKAAPSGWYYQNMLATAHFFEDYFMPVVDGRTHRLFPEKAERALTDPKKLRATPYNLLASFFMKSQVFEPELGNYFVRTARIQTALDHAALACALEKHRLARGSYPETLNGLVPEFAKSLPRDVITGEYYFYKNSGAQYLLYSVGWNKVDDGGKIVNSSRFIVDDKQGDWVWNLWSGR